MGQQRAGGSGKSRAATRGREPAQFQPTEPCGNLNQNQARGGNFNQNQRQAERGYGQQPAPNSGKSAFGNYGQGGNARTNSARGQQSLAGNRGGGGFENRVAEVVGSRWRWSPEIVCTRGKSPLVLNPDRSRSTHFMKFYVAFFQAEGVSPAFVLLRRLRLHSRYGWLCYSLSRWPSRETRRPLLRPATRCWRSTMP